MTDFGTDLPAAPPLPEPPEPARASNPTLIIVGAAVAVAAIVAVAMVAFVALRGGGEPKIKGTMTLFDVDTDPSISGSAIDCEGTGGYSDISEGMPIQITDAAGKVIGSSAVQSFDSTQHLIDWTADVTNGEPLTESDLRTLDGNFCSFWFEADVPRSDFYVVKIGNRRGEVTYSHDDMVEKDWGVEITIGN